LSQKTFIDNITTQVMERHICAIASEPPLGKRQRDLLENKIKKLNDGQRILRSVMRSAAP
ncbi:MAG: hypothetical protein Q9226_009091, partial [Calogaya cf. arnoldii]